MVKIMANSKRSVLDICSFSVELKPTRAMHHCCQTQKKMIELVYFNNLIEFEEIHKSKYNFHNPMKKLLQSQTNFAPAIQ